MKSEGTFWFGLTACWLLCGLAVWFANKACDRMEAAEEELARVKRELLRQKARHDA